MYIYQVKFVTLSDDLTFEIKSGLKESIEEFVNDILSIFVRIDENEKLVIESLQKNTPEIREKLNTLNEKYKSKVPQLNGVPAFFRKLKENEQFFFLPNIELDTVSSIKLHNYLRASTENISVEELDRQMIELFGEIINKYNVAAFGDRRISIGEPVKGKRICRFCNNKKQNCTFDNKAHAISEALGNKTITLYDECDVCNSDFSRSIEPDIIQYLSIFRTMHDVKGKGGSKEFTGQNFDMKKEGDVILTFNSLLDKPEDLSLPYNLKLETGKPITLQNIYKCLCKYFLSVVDTEHLDKFKSTLDWINGEKQLDYLPKIGQMISYHSFTLQPKIVVYIRKDEDRKLPFAVGEFYFTCKIFTFIIPLTSKDDIDFTQETDFDSYWSTFQHHKKSNGWSLMDYSNNKPKKFILNLSFSLEDKSNLIALRKGGD